MNFLNKLIEIDHRIFVVINRKCHSTFLDVVLPFTREPQIWMPFYFFIILFAIINFGKRGALWVFSVLLTIGVTDYVSSTIIKNLVGRLRPCQELIFADQVRLLVNACPGNPSFPSSHAVNHFAIAMFIFITFRGILGYWRSIIFLWALIITYSQVYVGVHFPIDVTCGAILGCLFGYLPAKLFNQRIGLCGPVSK